VALFITDPERPPDSPLETLARLYGLTPAESRLLHKLMIGCTLEEAACQLQISVKTARSQMKRVFLKTDTSRQSEVLRLVLGSPAMVRSD
jgi:DNA-binding CsgD family transcriptional regulator